MTAGISLVAAFALAQERDAHPETPQEAPPPEGAATQADAADGGSLEATIANRAKEAAPCSAQEARIQRRKAWLSQRLKDQAARGMPNPQTAVPNTTGLYCEAHPKDEECIMGPPVAEFSPDELSWDSQKTPEDRDPHVIMLKRELEACRRRNR